MTRGLVELLAMAATAEKPSREIDVLTHAVLGFDTPRVSIYFPDGTLQHWWKFAGSEVVSHIKDPLHYIKSFADAKHRVPLYSASLEAALALAEKLFPEWRPALQKTWNGWWEAELAYPAPRKNTRGGKAFAICSDNSRPAAALAMLLATLRAFEEDMTSHGLSPENGGGES
ncbi:MAG: hypothetical protein ACRCYS_04975 [Beijerinckiaceae bacterium]